MIGGLPTLVRIDARRPATWLAAAAAALVAGLLPADLPDAALPPFVVAAVGGALLAVAAVGAAPRTGARTLDAMWIATRAAWPLVAWSVVAWSRGAWPVASWGAGGIAAAAALFMLLGNLDLAAADASSAVLAAAGLAGAAGWWAARQVPEAAWASAAAVAVMAAIMPVVAVYGAGLRCGRMPPLRHAVCRGLTAAAMISALLGMVGWLFLAPEFAALDLAASLAWFSALAVPAATLGDGASHRREWRRVERTVPRVGGAARRLTPGRRRDSILAALVNAAILGWPPLVAAAVSGFGGQRSVPAALIAAALTAAACLLLAITEAGDALGASPELEQAVALGGIVVLAALVVGGSPGFPTFPPGRT